MEKTLNIAIIALAAFVARADYLYWQITQTETSLIDAYWNNAFLQTTDGTILQSAVATEGATGVTWVDLEGYEAQSFFIELVDYNESANTVTTVGNSSVYTYSQLTDYIVASSAFPRPEISAAFMPTINPVPEPTSATLLLFGLSALALKRKRARSIEK